MPSWKNSELRVWTSWREVAEITRAEDLGGEAQTEVLELFQIISV